MSSYKEKFLDPRWQKKRLYILERDEFSCCICGDTEETLHIHHKFYNFGLEPWDYPDDSLETLCATCHQTEGWSKDDFNRQVRELLTEGFTYEHLSQYMSGLQPPLNINQEDRVRVASFLASQEDILVSWKKELSIVSPSAAF